MEKKSIKWYTFVGENKIWQSYDTENLDEISIEKRDDGYYDLNYNHETILVAPNVNIAKKEANRIYNENL